MKEKSDILVSISCTTYNHAPYIRECLDGFLMQKCDFGFEVLIHDDASTDGTIDIIKEYQEKYPEIIKPYIQKENQWSKGVRGMNAKYNFSRAQGKYIALCEGDDYWIDPLKLQKQVDFLEENEEYGLVHTDYNILYEKSGKIKNRIADKSLARDNEFQYYVDTGDMRTCTVLFRSMFLDKINDLFNQQFMKGAVIGDRPLFLLIGVLSKLKYLNEITSIYRITSKNSASHFTDIYKYYNYLLSVVKLNEDVFSYLSLPEIKDNSDKIKFYKIVVQSKNSPLKSFYNLLKSGLGLQYYREYFSVIKYNLCK